MNEEGSRQTRKVGMIQWSVEHPYVIIAFYLGILLLFASALRYLPLRMMPYIRSPLIAVITMAPGMGPREVETYISKPIEERLDVLRGVRYIRSTSQPNLSMVSLEFWYGQDMDKSLVDTLTLMQTAQGDLPYDPANLKPSWVIPIDPLNIPVLVLSMKGKGWDPIALRQLAENDVVKRLKSAKGVESVEIFGGLKRQAQVIVDRRKLAAYGLSLLTIKKSIDGQNVDRASGRLTTLSDETQVRTPSRALQAGDMADYTVGSSKNGGVVYLKDVAQIKDTYQERRSMYRYNGDEAIAVKVIQNPTGSSPETIANVMKEIDQLKEENPGLSFDVAFDYSHFVKIIRHNTFEELLIGILLTGLVVSLFLGEWRGTLISLVTIPTSLGIAMLLMLPLGLSLNSSTLIGLLLAIGRLVDDSIIDLHSIQRHLKMGKPPKQAAIEGTSEVRVAVIASTFMICLALLPLPFSGGLTQEMFKGIVWPFIFSLLASLLVSLTLTPLLAAYLYRPYDPKVVDPVLRLVGPFHRFLDKLENRYKGILGWSLQNRLLVVAVIAAFTLSALFLYPYIGSEMMPPADVGQAYLTVEAWPGTSFAKTAQMANQVEAILKKHPEIQKVSLEIGNEMGIGTATGTYFTGYGMGEVNNIMAMVTFSDKEERHRMIWQVMDGVYNETMTTIPGIRRMSFKEMGADVMAGPRAPIETLIYGKELPYLSWLAEETKKLVSKNPDLVQVSTSWSNTQPVYRLYVDHRRAQQLGVSPEEIAMQAYYGLNGGLAFEFFNPPLVRHDTVLIRYNQGDRRNGLNLADLIIQAPNGHQAPLKNLARIEQGYEPSLIEHDGLRRSISVLGYYRKGGPGSMNLTMDMMMKSLLNLPYPPAYGAEQRGDMTQMMDSFTRLLRGLALAILFIYLSLVAQFRSLTQPFTMLMAIPLELFGAFLALILAHQTFSTVSILGFIVLNGMDVTASILLIDLVMHLRQNGVERNEAIQQAGPIRLRPILMTVFITLVVLAPVALFPKTGMDAYAPLATVIIGGLSLSTLLTLIAIPVIYTLVDDAGSWVRNRLATRSLKEENV